MSLLTALGALGKIAGALKSLMGWLRDGRLILAGEDKANLQHSNKVLSNVEKATEAERRLADPDERKRVREKHFRD